MSSLYMRYGLLCECANCDNLLVLHCHLSCDLKRLLKSSTLLFLDVDLYLQSDFALSELSTRAFALPFAHIPFIPV